MKSVKRMAPLIGALVAVIAVALPAAASAAQLEQTLAKTSPWPVGTKITATSSNAKLFGGAGQFGCVKTTLNGEVKVNSGGAVQVGGTGAQLAEHCYRNGWSFTEEVELTQLSLSSPSSGTAGLRIAILAGPLSSCSWESSTVPVTYVYGSSSIHIKGAMKPVPAACGTMAYEGDFALTHPSLGWPIYIK